MDKNHSEERCSVDRYTDDGRLQILVDSETSTRSRFIKDGGFGYVTPVSLSRYAESGE